MLLLLSPATRIQSTVKKYRFHVLVIFIFLLLLLIEHDNNITIGLRSLGGRDGGNAGKGVTRNNNDIIEDNIEEPSVDLDADLMQQAVTAEAKEGQNEDVDEKLPIDAKEDITKNKHADDDEQQTTTSTTATVATEDEQTTSGKSANADNAIFTILPNIQLIGMQKAGTTATSDYLYDEIGVCQPKRFDGEPGHFSKEVHFFNNERRYEKGIKFYGERFKYCQQRRQQNNSVELFMDATPNTVGFPERVKEAYEHAGGDQLSKLKILVILRDPVARDLSWYNQMLDVYISTDHERLQKWEMEVEDDDGQSPMSFHKWANDVTMKKLNDIKDYIPDFFGTYSRHLRRWFQLFDRKQILVLSYDELRLNPMMFQQRLLQFLGVSLGNVKLKPFPISNTNSHSFKIVVPACVTQSMLANAYESFNEELHQLMDEFEGPPMEQRPFPRFSIMNCSVTGEIVAGSG